MSVSIWCNPLRHISTPHPTPLRLNAPIIGYIVGIFNIRGGQGCGGGGVISALSPTPQTLGVVGIILWEEDYT